MRCIHFGCFFALAALLFLPHQAQSLPQRLLPQLRFQQALTGQPIKNRASVLALLDKEPTALHKHIEALALANTFSSAEKQALLLDLLKRRQRNEASPWLYFDYGYAQLLLTQNKTGLFFLRKANDSIETAITSLAYAVAQADVDLFDDKEKPTEPTARKLDVVFLLDEAFAKDSAHHTAGFWPAYIKTIKTLQAMPAYQPYLNRDFSLRVLPYGDRSPQVLPALALTPPKSKPSKAILKKQDAAKAALAKAYDCNPAKFISDSKLFNVSGSVLVKQVKFKRTTDEALNFYWQPLTSLNSPASPETKGASALLTVAEPAGRVLGEFPVSQTVLPVEDLERDGQFELVFRQFEADPLRPVQVYRLKPCGFELDKSIEAKFL